MAVLSNEERVLFSDYRKLAEENNQLKKEIMRLTIKMDLLRKGLEFLAQRLDETDTEIGLRANNEYLLKQILQK